MFESPGLIWVALLCFILFGGKKLPEFARAAGEAMREFKKASHEAFADEHEPAAQAGPHA